MYYYHLNVNIHIDTYRFMDGYNIIYVQIKNHTLDCIKRGFGYINKPTVIHLSLQFMSYKLTTFIYTL